MARTRRRMSRTPRRARIRRADWVYRPNIYDTAGAAIDSNGTYVPGASVLVGVGVALANANVLYDSANYIQANATMAGNAPRVFPSWGRGEGVKARVHYTIGQLTWTPSTWVLGSNFFPAARIVILEQDVLTGNVIVDPTYTLWAEPTAMAISPARWANDGKWFWEKHELLSFSSGNEKRRFRWTFNVPIKRTLKPNECLALWYELATGSEAGALNMICRTLVTDER